MLRSVGTRATGLLGAGLLLFAGALVWATCLSFGAEEPPALNPFGPRPTDEEESVPGYVEMSDGTVYPGLVHMTRDKRLKIEDAKLERQREIPLRAVQKIECSVLEEWMEKEWKFKELALDEKMYTGRSYPARKYVHTITLKDDRTLTGPLAEIIYVKPYIEKPAPGSKAYSPETPAEPRRFILHKRDKGEVGKDLKSLLYVKLVKLGEEALEEGRQKAGRRPSGKTSSTDRPSKRESSDR